MAVTVSVLSVAAGSVFIGILAPLVVKQTQDLQVIFFWQVPCWAAIVAWGAFAISDAPEEPPSAAAELQRLRRASTQRSLASLGYTPDSGAVQQVWENGALLLGDANFMCLAWSVSILTGMGYAYLTVIGQMLGPCGYSDNLVGDSIAAFSAANAVGCILYVYILSHEGSSRSYQAYQARAILPFIGETPRRVRLSEAEESPPRRAVDEDGRAVLPPFRLRDGAVRSSSAACRFGSQRPSRSAWPLPSSVRAPASPSSSSLCSGRSSEWLPGLWCARPPLRPLSPTSRPAFTLSRRAACLTSPCSVVGADGPAADRARSRDDLPGAGKRLDDGAESDRGGRVLLPGGCGDAAPPIGEQHRL